MSQVIMSDPSSVSTSESNSSIDENNRYNTDSERGATTVLKLKRHSTLSDSDEHSMGEDADGNHDDQTYQFSTNSRRETASGGE